MRIQGKLLGAFGLVLALFLGASALVAHELHLIRASSELQATRLADENRVLGIQIGLGQLAQEQAAMLGYGVEMASADQAARIATLKQQSEQTSRAAHTPEQRAAAERLHRGVSGYLETFAELRAAHAQHAGRPQAEQRALHAISERAEQLREQSTQDIQALSQAFGADSRAAHEEMKATLRHAMTLLALAGVLALLVSGAVAWAISTRLTRAIRQASGAAQALAQGRLELRALPASRDELGEMGQAFRRMAEALRQIIGGVRREAATVASAADRLSDATQELAATAGEQAAAAEETDASINAMTEAFRGVLGHTEALTGQVDDTASSMAEMAASIEQIARGSADLSATGRNTQAAVARLADSASHVAADVHEASRMAERAASAAADGRAAVDASIAGMNRIEGVVGEAAAAIDGLGARSTEIGRIVGLIEEIADQTNLLALNAAIEAARAGEAGRGFAVVADEVRKLAERAGSATGEIAALVRAIQAEAAHAVASTRAGAQAISEGSQLTEQAGGALNRIVEAAGHLAERLDDITAAAETQKTDAAEIARAMAQMGQLAQASTLATEDQSQGAARILQAVEAMNRMVHDVARANQEQLRSAEQVRLAIAGVSHSVRQSQQATDRIAETALGLRGNAHSLTEALSFFDGHQKPSSAEPFVTAVVLPNAVARP